MASSATIQKLPLGEVEKDGVVETTLLELVQTIGELTADDREVLATVIEMLRGGRVRLIGTPSTCMQFAQNSEEFAVDSRPPAYRWLTLGKHGELETAALNSCGKQNSLTDAHSLSANVCRALSRQAGEGSSLGVTY